MKLATYRTSGRLNFASVDDAGGLRTLPADIQASLQGGFDLRTLSRASSFNAETLPIVTDSPQLGPPVPTPSKFIAIGLNYRDHAEESGLPIPTEPVVFMKAPSCIVGPNDDVMLPLESQKTDWEVELGIVIGERASYVSEGKALDHVAGYLVVNDVSERAFQNERGGTWDKGKGCDTFGPLGPWLVTRDEIGDPQNLDLWLDLNGAPAQRGNTSTMIFSCAEIVAYVSRFMTLMPGDVITTGTPPGVGMGRKPPTFLKAGDTMSLGISGLGEQRQTVKAYERA
ncbi:fumarylacetoacetate hydrolase family protein [Terricaulis silvestris]|uniref:Ureidoglycolate lyase n=1 Tax=Terricaulis silvestris TaxID=2686094 RepID=A0A6I6MIJ6_9CAUL|nr:fumarylacetoacetate hydrolase family protein [Terricaulis silvestris]QGZ94925.1 Ureidoglycolate lyase [Terricaulis silvestris]